MKCDNDSDCVTNIPGVVAKCECNLSGFSTCGLMHGNH